MANHNARLGLRLFAIYVAFYGVFVLISAFSPATMELTPLAGVSLAIWAGAGLIALALLLAAVYGLAAKDADESSNEGGQA